VSALRIGPKLLILAMGLLLLAVGAIFVTMETVNAPPGPEVASTRVTSGQPFSVAWVSKGQPERAFLDARCAYVGFPFAGWARISASGATLATHALRVRQRGGSGGPSGTVDGITQLEARILFEVPATTAGTAMRIDGLLSLQPQTTINSTDLHLRREIPPPHELRFYVAP
jgi:hypothetical protein